MVVGSDLFLKAGELTERETRKLLSQCVFFDNERNEVRAYRIEKRGLRLHRGSWSLLPDHVSYVDKRSCPEGFTFKLRATLDYKGPDKEFQGQNDALKSALENEQGLVIAQPGWGKSLVACAVMAKVKTPSIVFVHTKDIFDQWVWYLKSVLPNAELGLIQEGEWELGDITVAMVQTVKRDIVRWREIEDQFGCVVVDEAHHAPADTWEAILNASSARYRFGFSATETRADGLHPLMKHLIGPVIYHEKFKSKVPVKVVPIKSGFRFPYRGYYDWGGLVRALIKDEARNELIAKTALRQMAKGHSCLILSRRIAHLESIYASMLFSWEKNAAEFENVTKILTAKTPKRRELVKAFRSGEVKCLLSTQLADEALDVPVLSRVFLTHPGKHDGRIIQQVGRALREHGDKTDAIVFDVVDDRVGILRRQWLARKRAYGKMDIQIKKLKEEIFDGDKKKEAREISYRLRERLGRGNRRIRSKTR